ncbi:hypothetical protein CV093_07060 [Oceanobacillus sp. 143]|nr:hypothetical protein CV093_07060 [Oceanobacillus sp. 143]
MAISKTNIGSLAIDYLFIAFFLFVSGSFLVISWLFFINIRKRLIKLELAMSRPDDEGFQMR